MALMTLLLIVICILLVLLSMIGVLANIVLLRPIRRLLYGLVTTYVAGPGAPVWIEQRDNIISLPIPSEVSTLSFEMKAEASKNLITLAYQETLRKLDQVL